jgi:hypothetical protein
MNKKKYIFLDFDGVLNNTSSICLGVFFIPEKVLLIDSLIDDDKNTYIVFITSWKDYCHISKLIFTLQVLGINLNEDKFDKTLDETVELDRNGGVVKYVNDHKIENYVIFDDVDEYDDENKKHLVLTMPETGLTIDDINKGKKILNNEIT